MNLTSTELISMLPMIPVFFGFVFLFKFLNDIRKRETVVLPPASPSGTVLGVRVFDLSKERSVNADFYFGIIAISLVGSFLTVILGAVLIQYVITNWHRLPWGGVVLLAALTAGGLWAVKFGVETVRGLLKALQLSASIKRREVVFEESKVLFHLGLVEFSDFDDLVDQGKAYLEIPYQQVSEVEGLQPDTSRSNSVGRRLKFVLRNPSKNLYVKRYAFGKYEKDIIEELQKRISVSIVLNEHPEDSFHSGT